MSKTHTPETCPNCGCDDNIESFGMWPSPSSHSELYYDFTCHECGAEWEEHYESNFIGHKNIQAK